MKHKLSLEKFSEKTVLVIGDYCIDEYLEGDAHTIAPEAPIPRVVVEKSWKTVGAAGNVVAGFAALGAKTFAVGVIGDDQQSCELLERMNELQVNTSGMVLQRKRITPKFTRIVVGGKHYPEQKVLRYDHENSVAVEEHTVERILGFLKKVIKDVDAVVVADYDEVGLGVVNEKLLASLVVLCKEHEVVLVGDSRKNVSLFTGFTAIVPNLQEAELAYGKKIVSVPDASRELLHRLELKALLITQDKDGMFLLHDSNGVKIPAIAKEVVDVTGAGDSVTCAFALGLCCGMSYEDAALLSSYAAAIAVSKEGVVAVSKDALEDALLGLSGVIINREQSTRIATQLRKAGKKIVTINGSFDILHAGHISLLQEAKHQGDVLFVGLNSDASVQAWKKSIGYKDWNKRPIVPQQYRAEMLAALECVDYVVMYDEPACMPFIEAIIPHVHVNGEDYGEDCIEKETVKKCGARLHIAKFVKGFSTTELIKRIVDVYGKDKSI